MAPSTPTEPRPKTALFENHVRLAVQTVRSAMAQMLSSVGADVSQPRSMAKQFGLDKTLAWKLSKIVGEENLATLVDYLPGRAGLDIAISTLEEAGASPSSVKAVRNAIGEFDHMVEVHCGDRETLELMLGHLRDDSEPQREEAHRKRAFQGNRAIWGVQARLQICAHFVAPSVTKPTMLDSSIVSGLVDLRRLRPETVWPVAAFRHYSDDGSPLPPGVWEPIDRNAMDAEDGLPVLRDFSSDPMPPMRCTMMPKGVKSFELVEGPLGAAAAVTCLTGAIHRGRFSRYRDEHDRFGEYLVTISTPVECLVHDLYVHRDLKGMLSPTYSLYSQLPNEPVYPTGGRDRGMLRHHERMIDLGESPTDVVTPEFPRYTWLTDMVIHRLGWAVRDFHGFRFRMRYPPMSSRAVFRHELPERP